MRFFCTLTATAPAPATLPSLVCAFWRFAVCPVSLSALMFLEPPLSASFALLPSSLSICLSVLPDEPSSSCLPFTPPDTPATAFSVISLVPVALTVTPLASRLCPSFALALSPTTDTANAPPSAVAPPAEEASA